MNLRKILYIFILIFLSGKTVAQYEYLLEFENLYEGCLDSEESITFGGTYPNPWPKDLNPPEFPGGGEIQLTRYIHINVTEDYPGTYDFVTRELLKDVVQIQVVIDRCGRATRQRIVKSKVPEYAERALEIAKQLPVFKPGSLHGERVKVALTIPFYFNRSTIPKKKKSYDDAFEELNYDDY
jgi:hypothetical protein